MGLITEVSYGAFNKNEKTILTIEEKPVKFYTSYFLLKKATEQEEFLYRINNKPFIMGE